MAAKSTRSSGTDSVSYWTKKTYQQRSTSRQIVCCGSPLLMYWVLHQRADRLVRDAYPPPQIGLSLRLGWQ
jgi:hypothetical protein